MRICVNTWKGAVIETVIKYFNQFELKSIVIPGGYALSFLLITNPNFEYFVATITFGGFAFCVFLSFVAGHLINSLSYFLEIIFFRLFGGMPTDWIFGENRAKKKWAKVLTENQKLALDDLLQKKLTINPNSVISTECRAVVHQLRLFIPDDKLQRLIDHNTNYCFHRASSTTSILLACYFLFIGSWVISSILLIFVILFSYRMYKFGIYYARELFLQFINASHSEG